MDLLDLLETLVKNPLLDISILDDSNLRKNLIKSYKKSDTHKIRKLIANKKMFCDMSHAIPYANINPAFSSN